MRPRSSEALLRRLSRLRDAVVPRRLYSFRCAPAGCSADADLFIGNQGKRLAHRAYLNLGAPPASGVFVVRITTTGSSDERALIGIGASRVIGARAGGTGGFVDGPTLELDRWYRIDLVYDLSDEHNYTLDWQVDGVPQPRATYQAGVSTDIVMVGLGYEGEASSGVCYFKPEPAPASAIARPIPFPRERANGLAPPIVSRTLRAIRDAPRRWAQSARLLLLDLTRHPRQAGCTKKTRECCIFTWGDVAMPDCCVSHMKELTFFLDDLLTRHGIKHWLDGGALLGAVRAGEFVPWDQDVDFGILAEDFFALLELAPEIEAAGYHFDPYNRQVLYGPFNYNHADLAVWEEVDGRLVLVGDLSQSYPKGWVESFDEVRLYGRALPAPSPVHRYLENWYGADYMTERTFILNSYLKPPGLHRRANPKRTNATRGSLVFEVSYLSIPIFDGDPPAELPPNAWEEDAEASGVDEHKASITIRRLLDRIAEADWRLHERLGSRFFRPVWAGGTPAVLRLVQPWVLAPLPSSADDNRVERLRNDLPEADASPLAEQLIGRLALAEQALEELERSGPLRRTGRRLAWLGAAVAARIARRSPPDRFPYWLEG